MCAGEKPSAPDVPGWAALQLPGVKVWKWMCNSEFLEVNDVYDTSKLLRSLNCIMDVDSSCSVVPTHKKYKFQDYLQKTILKIQKHMNNMQVRWT